MNTIERLCLILAVALTMDAFARSQIIRMLRQRSTT
jgi:hypothetical protein